MNCISTDIILLKKLNSMPVDALRDAKSDLEKKQKVSVLILSSTTSPHYEVSKRYKNVNHNFS